MPILLSDKEEALFIFRIKNVTLVIERMTLFMAMECIFSLMMNDMKGSSRMVLDLEKANTFSKTGIFMMENGLQGRNMEKANIISMELMKHMRVNLKMVLDQEMGNSSLPSERFTMGISRTTLNQVMENFNTKMAIFTKDTGKKTLQQAKE